MEGNGWVRARELTEQVDILQRALALAHQEISALTVRLEEERHRRERAEAAIGLRSVR